MWRLFWFRRRTYEVWMPARYLLTLATDCPFRFTVYRKCKDRHGRTSMLVKFYARPGSVYAYMHRRNWKFVTQDGMTYEIEEEK